MRNDHLGMYPETRTSVVEKLKFNWGCRVMVYVRWGCGYQMRRGGGCARHFDRGNHNHELIFVRACSAPDVKLSAADCV
jgi:hypothetical protein